MAGTEKYSGRGYWAVQIGFAALLAALGLAGGVFILIDSGSPGSTGSTGAGEGAIVLLVGIVFLMLLVWLIVSCVSQSRRQRAIYAWAIMQDYAARHPGSRPVRPRSAVVGDVAAMATAARARDGELTYEEVLRLQALRPEVPYPGDLEALRRASEASPPAPVSEEERERRRAGEAADDADARSRLEAAGLHRPGPVRVARLAARVTGWAAVAAFLVSIWAGSTTLSVGAYLGLVGLWCVVRLVGGALQDARTRRGRALADAWLADPERAARGLPAPFAEFFESPLGAWWARLLTPMMLVGTLLLLGGAANLGGAAGSADFGAFLGMVCVGAGLLLASIVLRILVGRRAAADRDRLVAYRGRREAPPTGIATSERRA